MSKELDILEQQEHYLQFEHFTNNDAYALGTFMVEYARLKNITIAVSIRLPNGYIAFQHGPDGTNLLNQKWMERKFNTVLLMERSSLRTSFVFGQGGDTLAVHGLKEEDYALCGGGFPIRIKDRTGVAGVIIASNLYHIADHEFIIDCLKEYLHCPDAPSFPYTVPE